MEEKHDFDGDPDGAVADAEDDVGLNVAAVREVSGDSNRQVDQEQNWKKIKTMIKIYYFTSGMAKSFICGPFLKEFAL